MLYLITSKKFDFSTSYKKQNQPNNVVYKCAKIT